MIIRKMAPSAAAAINESISAIIASAAYDRSIVTGISVGMEYLRGIPSALKLKFRSVLRQVRNRSPSPDQKSVGARLGPDENYVRCSSCAQMLILRVSGIRNRLRIRHTAGTAI